MYKSLDDLPVSFNPEVLGKVLNVSRATAYNLANSSSFYPALRIGKRILINKEAFIRWMQEKTKGQVET